MAGFQLDKLSGKDLVELEARVSKVLADAIEREKASVKQKVVAILHDAGLDVEDLSDMYGLARARGARKGTKVAPKYRNPDNRLETWTGRGRQPRWLVALLGKGKKLADFVI